MISKEIHILTNKDLFELTQNIFYMGESGQYAHFDQGVLNNCLKEVEDE